ncbi:MAG: hypothetical protein ACFCBV_11340 [Phycisphaerales bacterium]
MIRTAALVSFLAVAPAALAQVAITIEVDNPLLSPGESTTVTLFAAFERSDYAMAAVGTDFQTSVGSVGWSDAMLLAPMDAIGTEPGVPSSSGYDGILAGQLNIPSDAYADPMNPVMFWQATYTAPMDVAAPFVVDLSTLTDRYDVYPDMSSARSESRLDELDDGFGTITVIPAPASAVVLALGIAGIRRRR